jgi:acetate kinase
LNNRLESNVLTMNAGSSSLKTALYRIGQTETRICFVSADRIGSPAGRIIFADGKDAGVVDDVERLPDFGAALLCVLSWIEKKVPAVKLDGVGHRIVIGDSRWIQPERISQELLRILAEAADFAPDHIPPVLEGIGAVARKYPSVPQVACFDSAFHSRLPRVARMFALPRRFFERGVMRYGFHGLSCEYVMDELIGLDPEAARGRVLVAHLGNGSSITAIHKGASTDTSMGFTPLPGLVMGTRCGDLDPGAALYLMNKEGMTAPALSNLLNKESGLLGLSGRSGDMRDLLRREPTDPDSAEAIAVFCYQAKKFIGAYTAALGGLDTLVFTGGIGEHAAVIRERICTGLDFLGITLDAARNMSHAPVISIKDGAVTVRVIKTNEDLMIARHTRRVIAEDQ